MSLNILQILPELKSGGVERGTVDLAKYLKKKGHGSVVVSAGGPLVGELVAADVKHYALPVHRKNPWAIVRCTRALSKIIEMENIDVIHARSRVPAVIAYFAGRRTNKPFVTTCHGFYSRHFLSRFMGWGKIVIVASHVIGRRMRDDFRVPQRKIRFVPRGVNLDEFHPAAQAGHEAVSKEVIVGMIGRLTPIKGHAIFLKAMVRVARMMPHVKIQIIGDTDKIRYKEELQMLTRRLGLGDAVQFMGTRYDIPQLLSQMAVLVVPSVGEEAFGRVVIEAGACGVPVVASRIGGLVDIIEHEKEGLLVPPDDIQSLSEAILRLLKEPAAAQAMAVALRQKVEKQFNLEQMFTKTLAVYEEAQSRQKILVIKLSALGDVILSIPSLRALRKAYPNAWISALVGRRSRGIVRNCPYVNDTLVYDESAGIPRVVRMLRMARILSREDFDIAVDLQNNRLSHSLSFLSGARVRAGYQNGKWSFFLNRRAKDVSYALPPVEHQFQVLKLLGIEETEKELELWTRPAEDASIADFWRDAWVATGQTLVGINLSASARWPTKQWGIENYAKLCEELARRNIRVVLTGAPEDKGILEKFYSLTRVKPVSAVGKTSITELVALIRRCQVFVSSDSAPMHIASGLGVPLVALFGPTDPKRHLVPPARYEVFWKEVPCSPCYLRNCPIGHVCMKKITVQEVLNAILYLLKENPVLVEEIAS